MFVACFHMGIVPDRSCSRSLAARLVLGSWASAEPDAPSATLAKLLRLSVPQFLIIKWEY